MQEQMFPSNCKNTIQAPTRQHAFMQTCTCQTAFQQVYACSPISHTSIGVDGRHQPVSNRCKYMLNIKASLHTNLIGKVYCQNLEQPCWVCKYFQFIMISISDLRVINLSLNKVFITLKVTLARATDGITKSLIINFEDYV